MIIPGILEENFDEVKNKIRLIEEVAQTIQLDILDNTIVEGKTFTNLKKLGGIETNLDITIHYMVRDPLSYIQNRGFFSLVKTRKIDVVSTIVTQLIEENGLRRFIKFSKDIGYKVGLSLNSDEDISLLQPFINDIDVVQFMSVVPGRQGNEFIPSVLDKIRDFKKTFPKVKTQIDGGVNEATLPQVLETSVDNIVVGSALFKSEDPKSKFLEFSKLFETAYGQRI
ncbi:hypothetical protein K0B04_01460 [Patescibacteria group bacterium]|nr:hypothetical protein [Patescibacteria group bacterium]